MFNFKLYYHFPYKFFELIQICDKKISDESEPFERLYNLIRNAGYINASKFYYSFSSSSGSSIYEEEFGNFKLKWLEASDYELVSFEDILSDYSSSEEDLLEDVSLRRDKPEMISFEEMHRIIGNAIKMHVSEKETIYRLNTPKISDDKIGMVNIWENFQHYVCIDLEKQLIHIITSGYD